MTGEDLDVLLREAAQRYDAKNGDGAFLLLPYTERLRIALVMQRS